MKPVAVIACVAAVCSASCVHFHRDDGAPGHVNLRAPPAFPEMRSVEPARYPGEAMLVVTPAVFGLTGSYRGSDTRLLGAELSIEGAWDTEEKPAMHGHDDVRMVSVSYGWGLTLGVQAAFVPGTWQSSAGPMTAEVRRRFARALVAGAGWAWDPQARRHDVVASAVAAVFMLRAGYLPGGAGGFVSIGLNFAFPITWVWTR